MRPPPSARAGLTLLETLIACLVLAVGCLAIVSALAGLMRLERDLRRRDAALAWAHDALASTRAAAAAGRPAPACPPPPPALDGADTDCRAHHAAAAAGLRRAEVEVRPAGGAPVRLAALVVAGAP